MKPSRSQGQPYARPSSFIVDSRIRCGALGPGKPASAPSRAVAGPTAPVGPLGVPGAYGARAGCPDAGPFRRRARHALEGPVFRPPGMGTGASRSAAGFEGRERPHGAGGSARKGGPRGTGAGRADSREGRTWRRFRADQGARHAGADRDVHLPAARPRRRRIPPAAPRCPHGGDSRRADRRHDDGRHGRLPCFSERAAAAASPRRRSRSDLADVGHARHGRRVRGHSARRPSRAADGAGTRAPPDRAADGPVAFARRRGYFAVGRWGGGAGLPGPWGRTI